MHHPVPLETLAGYGQHDEEMVAQYDPSVQWDGLLPFPADLGETEEEKALVWQAINTLPDMERRAVFLFYFYDWSIPALCRLFGQPKGSIYRRLRKAKQKIATWLNDHGKAEYLPSPG